MHPFIKCFVLFIILFKAGICSEKFLNENHPVAMCLKELDGLSNYNQRKKIKIKCLSLAKKVYEENKSLENKSLLLEAAISFYYTTEQNQREYFRKYYQKYFTSFSLERVEGKDLEYLFKIYRHLSFFIPEDILAFRFKQIFYKLKFIRPMTKEEKEGLLYNLIFSQLWGEVEKFQQEYKIVAIDPLTLNNLKLIQGKKYPQVPKYYELDVSGYLTVKNYNPPKEFSVVVISSSGCGFSQDAMIKIGEDKELREFFKKYGIFIVSQSGFSELEDTIKWNVQFSTIPLKIVFLEKEWPSEIDWAGTPHFIFFKKQKYSHSFPGWDKDLLKKSINWLKNGKGKFKF